MQNTKNNPTTKNYTISLSKEIGKLWIANDINPFRVPFLLFYDKELGHDVGNVMTCGATNDILDILAAGETRMNLDLRIASERVVLPGYVEFELVQAFNLSAKYLVNNCPERPQMIAWVNSSVRVIFKDYPLFAYIKKAERTK